MEPKSEALEVWFTNDDMPLCDTLDAAIDALRERSGE